MVTTLLLAAALAVPGLSSSKPEMTFEGEMAAICARHAGKPLFERDGQTSEFTCDWAREIARSPPADANIAFRRLFAAGNLARLRGEGVPADLDCGGFNPVATAEGKTIRCEFVHQGLHTVVVFHGDRLGAMTRIEMTAPLKAMRLAAHDDAVKRGSITRHYEAFADASVEIYVAKLRAHAQRDEVVEYDAGMVHIVLTPPPPQDEQGPLVAPPSSPPTE